MARIPVDPEETLRLIEQFDRTPFQEALADHLGCQPTPQALQAFANKYPDRYWQATTMLWGLAGGREAPVVSISIQARLNLMSDAEVAKQLAELNRKLLQFDQRFIPAQATGEREVNPHESPQPIDSSDVVSLPRSDIMSHDV